MTVGVFSETAVSGLWLFIFSFKHGATALRFPGDRYSITSQMSEFLMRRRTAAITRLQVDLDSGKLKLSTQVIKISVKRKKLVQQPKLEQCLW